MANRADGQDLGERRERSGRWPLLLAAAFLALLIAAVFYPIVSFEFVDWDVFTQVVENPYIRGLTLQNIKYILTTRCITSYYPVRTLSYALNYQVAGLNPWVYKLTNGLIHYANVLLVFWLILRLFRHPAAPPRTRGAWWDTSVAVIAAGIYAVHPVVVEPVTWVAGREELLLVLNSLGCFHFHLTARELSRQEGRGGAAFACYAGAAACCVLASLSNAVAAVIPLLITAWDLLTLQHRKLWRTFSGAWALWTISAVTIITKRLGEGDVPIEPAVFTLRRNVLILNIYWLNLKTLAWPTKLSLYYDWIYPNDPLEPEVLLGGAALVLTLILLWGVRKQRLALYGLLWFGLALGPVAQIMPHHIQRADRFLYLPLVGLAAAIALGLRSLGAALKARTAVFGVLVAGALLLLLLAIRSSGQTYTWRNSLSAWENCLWVNPNNARAHDAFADNLVVSGRFDQAIPHYEKVLEILPNCVEALTAYGVQLAANDVRLRDYDRAVKLGTRAAELTRWESKDVLHDLAMIFACQAMDFQQKGAYGQAIQTYRNSLRVEADYLDALFNLALMLATCPDPQLRNPQEAVNLAERASLTSPPHEINGWLILATAYAQAGSFQMAAMTMDKAIYVAQAMGDVKLFESMRQQQLAYLRGELPADMPAPAAPLGH